MELAPLGSLQDRLDMNEGGLGEWRSSACKYPSAITLTMLCL